jgi:hypothetical protein
MIVDKFRAWQPDCPPASTIFTIEPNDATDLPVLNKAINVAKPGALRVTMADGSIGMLFLAAGSLTGLRVCRIWATGPSAEGICGLS